MISLRELHEKDAPFMIEWMHDPDNQRWFKKDMLGTSIENIKSFCLSSKIPKLIESLNIEVFKCIKDVFNGEYFIE